MDEKKLTPEEIAALLDLIGRCQFDTPALLRAKGKLEDGEVSDDTQVYTCTSFDGFWPVGSAAAISARSPSHASALLNAALVGIGLSGDRGESDLTCIYPGPIKAHILCDGNY